MPEADVSFVVSTVGLTIPFVIQEFTGVSDVYGTAIYAPISYAQSATVTWIAANGVRRPLTLTTPASGTFVYITSAYDYQAPRQEQGQLMVSVAATTYFTSTFLIRVVPHL